MAIIKCKMCGGDLVLTEGSTIATCEFCGSQQTVPTADSEKKLTLFARANRLRMGCEFDKAAGVYESIVADFPEEAEAYWGLVLCKYGIEYVDDPATGKKIPTCHRSSFESIMDDSDLEQALENADLLARKQYRDEAKQIEELRKGIIAVSANEQPYDIFICYKETDASGERTLDSVLAQDIYDALTAKNYRVFFSRITLEDKLGVEYEPYIFAALNSAKIMLAVGTDYEYYNAVWVKNEWSRYLKLMAKDKEKHLIPCFKGIDAYDMPKEFAKLQAQDLGKVGAMQDLLRGIDKILPKNQPVTVVQEKVVVGGSGFNKIASLLDRGNMALEDGDWAKADSFFEDVLNNDSKNAQAYLGKTLAQEKCRTVDAFIRKRKEATSAVQGEILHLEPNEAHIAEIVEKYTVYGYLHADTIRSLHKYDLSYHSTTAERKAQYRAEESYWANHKLLSRAEKFAVGAVAENLMREKKALFAALSDRVKQAENAEKSEKDALLKRYSDFLKQADAAAEERYRRAAALRETNYNNWLQQTKDPNSPETLKELEACFIGLGDFRDSKSLAEYCRKRAEEKRARIEAAQEAERIRLAKQRAAQKKKNTILMVVTAVAVVLAIAAGAVIKNVMIPQWKYDDALKMMEAGNIVDAYESLIALEGYKDSVAKASSIYTKYETEMLKNTEVGDYAFFGTYEQDNNAFNGGEDIEWLILEKTDNKVLIISKNALACKPYNTTQTDVTWETCALRKWLNDDFINSAFTIEEQELIATVTVSADKNSLYATDPGAATQDRVFLLSMTEAKKYFATNDTRHCESTGYTFAKEEYAKSSDDNCWWWLRTPGGSQAYATYVNGDGRIHEVGERVSASDGNVRPALWIDLGD